MSFRYKKRRKLKKKALLVQSEGPYQAEDSEKRCLSVYLINDEEKTSEGFTVFVFRIRGLHMNGPVR